jgi:argininosuccinate lyase
MAKLWGGRFDKEPDKLLWAYNASIDFDRRMFEADISGSVAYAHALVNAGVLTPEEADTIVEGLMTVLDEFRQGTFAFAATDEDIHTAVERRLQELKGDVAGKLHTGRSRNDQVATDTRLYLLGKIGSFSGAGLRSLVRELQVALVDQAEAQVGVMMPGYTHLQPAQPILFSHWLMSFFWMLQRDVERLDDLAHRVAVLPLGSAALAGNTFGIDREALAEALGFEAVSQNSLDAVADRDFIAGRRSDPLCHR